jgi:aspartate racemase
MEEEFYKNRLKEKYDIETIIPEKNERKIIHDVIHTELSHEIIKQSSKKEYIKIINNLVSKGAQGVILGCTEIPLLIKQCDVDVLVFDTTSIHAKAAAEYALK